MHQITGWLSSISQQVTLSVQENTIHRDGKASGETVLEPSEKVDASVSESIPKVPDVSETMDKKEELHEETKTLSNKMFDFARPKAYADKLVGSVTSLANKIAYSNPDDLKHIFDGKNLFRKLDEENKKFADKNAAQQAGSVMEPVWRGCLEETSARKQILSLSLDSRNFLSDPPPSSQMDFQFDYDSAVPLAMAMLEEDPNLRKMRFQLVPKVISEDRFWRNYFYRISLIKQSIAMRSMVKQEVDSSKECSGEESVSTISEIHEASSSDMHAKQQDNTAALEETGPDSLLSPSNVEFLSDAGVLPDNLDPDLVAARQELGILSTESSPPANRKNMPENKDNWENDLLSELNDYELVSNNGKNVEPIQQQTGTETSNWEEEISELLKNDTAFMEAIKK